MIKLIQGDCLELMKDIPDGGIDCVICDPPYGTTACKWDTCIPFEPMWEQLKRITKKNGAIVLFGSQPFTSALVMSNPKMFKYCWYWRKNQSTNFFHAKRMPMRKVEEIIIFASSNKAYRPQITDGHVSTNSAKGKSQGVVYHGENNRNEEGGKTTRYPDNILEFKCVSNYERKHPTQKPVALMEYLIKTYTDEGDTVLDFTMGSGTCGVASKNLNRNFIGIELDQEYFKIAEKRIGG